MQGLFLRDTFPVVQGSASRHQEPFVSLVERVAFWAHLVPNFLGPGLRSGASPQPENSPRGSGIGR